MPIALQLHPEFAPQLPFMASQVIGSTMFMTALAMHMPLMESQRAQVPVQASLQQTPSAEKPLRQSAAFVVIDPRSPLQVPFMSHMQGGPTHDSLAVTASHAPASVAFVTASTEQVPSTAAPAATEQASQPPLQAALQQTPSAQKPLAHCEPIVHALPSATLQAPAASQTQGCIPLQLPAAASQAPASVIPFTALAVQVPFAVAPVASEQAEHAPVHAALQQNPSAQKPLAHSALARHASPIFTLQAPTASHVHLSVPSHIPAASGQLPAS